MLAREVFLLEACYFSCLLSNRTSFDRGLLIDAVNLHEDLGDLAERQFLIEEKLLNVLQK